MKLCSIYSLKFGTSGSRGLVCDMTGPVYYVFDTVFLQSVAGQVENVVIKHDLYPADVSPKN